MRALYQIHRQQAERGKEGRREKEREPEVGF